ncbi:sugar phosphate nucleotidyltransferase [Oscillatoria sp. FACHB-1406]|uniref:sugar phosphate nucleotidyltransferase n=1 Tax=Oscillatoria sp. FACHB-1406 TaxID=2692846 RepID=UPI001683D6FA|nr:sugar phosphate nucleotidyltransferase [Oscillatoria sp. FACHB-1406]MBD2578479.1 UTP--glucose-1-phosphate uridylyltransferase [Oscillatoria sp. FACHB-1406]
MNDATSHSVSIRKAVIPAAGFGTRMFPATKAIKKEFFPIIDREGRAKPIILAIVEEAIQAGIEEVGIVVQKRDRALFEEFFRANPSPTLYDKLKPDAREYCRYLQQLGERITLIDQDIADGFGYAVSCAKSWVNDELFLLLLGDHLYTSFITKNCSSQILDVYRDVKLSTIGMRIVSIAEIENYGGITGKWTATDAVLSITEIHEKPTPEFASARLRVRGMEEGKFLAVFGNYILTPTIFEILQENISNNARESGEFQLTSCLEKLRAREGMAGYLIKGQCFDVGLPDVYRKTIIDFRHARSDF